MLPAFFLLAAMPQWVPARWNSADVKSLALLAGTPINCLLLEEQNWKPEFIRAATGRDVATLGVLHAAANLTDAARRAAQLKMTGVVIEGDYAPDAAEQVRTAVAGTGLVVIE